MRLEDAPVCGCRVLAAGKVIHSRVCHDRGWSTMTAEEVAADKEKHELEELRKEAAEKVSEVRDDAKKYIVLLDMLLGISKAIRPTLPLKDVAEELRAVGKDLVPFVDILDDLSVNILQRSAMNKARAVKMIIDAGLTESAAVCLVLASSEAMYKSLNSGLKRKDKTEDSDDEDDE